MEKQLLREESVHMLTDCGERRRLSGTKRELTLRPRPQKLRSDGELAFYAASIELSLLPALSKWNIITVPTSPVAEYGYGGYGERVGDREKYCNPLLDRFRGGKILSSSINSDRDGRTDGYLLGLGEL